MDKKDIEYGFDENDTEELMDSFYTAMYEIDQRKDYEDKEQQNEQAKK